MSEPYRLEFERFERWALRAHAGEYSGDQVAALEEAVFAPILRSQQVLAASVEHQQARLRRLVFPSHAHYPVGLKTVALRTGDRAPLRVASFETCPMELPSWWRRGVARRCVILARTTQRGAGESFTVSVAFSLGQPSASVKADP